MSRVTIWVSRVCVLFVYIALLSLAVGISYVEAGSGMVLRPPFNGTYRLTSYFDHRYPNYDEDNQITIYTGESVSDCSPYCYHGHNGIDWSMLTGTDVVAAATEKSRKLWIRVTYIMAVESRSTTAMVTRQCMDILTE